MKSLAIKLGKAAKTIKEEGLFNGGKRVLSFLIQFLKTILRPKKGQILIITGGIGDSALFRAKHYCEELNFNGFKCEYTIQDDPFLLRYSKSFKVFIFHRTLLTDKIKNLIREIKKQKKEIIFETDDLVFDHNLFQKTETYQQLNTFEKKQYEKSIGSEFLKDEYVKVCTTTTSYLSEKLTAYGKRVFIVSNKLSFSDLRTAECIAKQKKPAAKKDFIIGYFSGSAGHNQDFATITNPLIKILDKYPQTRLFLAGSLKIEKKIEKYLDRIIFSTYVPRKKHFENIYRCDLILAPLVKNNPFCEAKSELKFFEAGIMKVPIVAVKNMTFGEAVSEGIDGFLAEDDDEWEEKIEKLINDENLRKTIGEKAMEKSLQKYTTKNGKNEEYYNYLRSKL